MTIYSWFDKGRKSTAALANNEPVVFTKPHASNDIWPIAKVTEQQKAMCSKIDEGSVNKPLATTILIEHK